VQRLEHLLGAAAQHKEQLVAARDALAALRSAADARDKEAESMSHQLLHARQRVYDMQKDFEDAAVPGAVSAAADAVTTGTHCALLVLAPAAHFTATCHRRRH
jgi:hypothetical protein